MKINSIINLSAVESTNNYAIGMILHKQAEEGTVVLAQHQLKGRGTGENYWESEAGKNLTFSILFAPEFLKPGDQFFLSMVVSLGVSDFVSSQAEGVKIKWPNDIYIGNKKAGGILIESTVIGNLLVETVAGVGLNINQEIFVSGAPNPVSLKNLSGINYNLQQSLEVVWENIMKWYSRLKKEEKIRIKEEYISRLYRFQEFGLFKSGEGIISGKIISIDEFGRLQIENRNGEVLTFQFKEVEHLITDKEV